MLRNDNKVEKKKNDDKFSLLITLTLRMNCLKAIDAIALTITQARIIKVVLFSEYFIE